MTLEKYLQTKQQRALDQKKYRTLCTLCQQTSPFCYCPQLRPFESPLEFVILIHPIESQRRIATGRMSHLALKNSWLIKGQDFSQNSQVQELIDDPAAFSAILWPGVGATNLSQLTEPQRQHLSPPHKKMRLFVMDGTWATARKMLRLSTNLKKLPRWGFTPPHPSRFRVRKQPHQNCLSTIEAIHHTIELFSPKTSIKPHDHLLDLFDLLVERQLKAICEAQRRTPHSCYRKPQQKN